MVGETRIPDPERDWKSDGSGMLSMGGRNVVECEPDVYLCSPSTVSYA
jgi:hypothetical protein